MTYHKPPRLGAVSSGFIPSECLVLVPDVGFQWLCGEPVHPDVIPLLATSQVPDPVVATVTPTRDVVAPDGTVLQEGSYGTRRGEQPGVATPYVPENGEPTEAGFGVMGLVATLLAGLAISSSLGGR